MSFGSLLVGFGVRFLKKLLLLSLVDDGTGRSPVLVTVVSVSGKLVVVLSFLLLACVLVAVVGAVAVAVVGGGDC